MTRKLWPFLLVAGAALAADFPALPDGGSIVTTSDAGPTIIVDTGQVNDWNMVIRCEGAQNTRYRLCTTSSCTPNTHNQLLDYDRTFDIPVQQGGGAKYRYLGLTTDDGGVPFCKVQTTTPTP